MKLSMVDFIHVVGNEGEVLEVELDDDGTFTVETLKSYFGEQAVGLKYRPKREGSKELPDVWKLVGLEGGRVVPPKQGWGEEMYTVKYTAAVYTPRTKESKSVFIQVIGFIYYCVHR